MTNSNFTEPANQLTDGQLLFRLQDFSGAEQDAAAIGDYEYAQECADIVSVIREVQQYRVAAANPVAWTDEQELRDVEKSGCGYLFRVNPITPHADPHRVIKLCAMPSALEPRTVTLPLAVSVGGQGYREQVVNILAAAGIRVIEGE